MRVRVFAGLVVLALLSGCGGPQMARVKGKVTCNGKPVAQATITFSPMQRHDKDREPGKPATGFTDEKGTYDLSTFRHYDGALVGKHRVTVTLDDANPARCPRSTATQEQPCRCGCKRIERPRSGLGPTTRRSRSPICRSGPSSRSRASSAAVGCW